MDFINTALVTLNPPTGFWQSILNAFKNGMGTYILAVIMIALIVRVLFSLVDIINKKVNMKNADINAKMKPELDAIKQRYGNDPQLMQQKTNQVYKKYQFNMMGSCLPMLIMMILQFTVFLTLWNSLQSVSNFNIANQYQNMKNIYANVIELNGNEIFLNNLSSNGFEEGDKLSVEVVEELVEDQKTTFLKVVLNKADGQDFEIGQFEYNKNLAQSNEAVYGTLEKYVIENVKNEEGEDVKSDKYISTSYNEVIKIAAEDAVQKYFMENKEGFLWIKNIYKSESPTSPMFTKSEITTYLSKFYSEEEKKEEETNKFEEKIFDFVVENNSQLDSVKSQHNGYYILTIIAVLTSVLSLWLSNFLMKDKSKPQQKQSWAMYLIMPIIIGIFTFMYTSLFAIYLVVGQLVMMILTPLTTLIVKKWNSHDENKKKDKEVIEVDYRRKDI